MIIEKLNKENKKTLRENITQFGIMYIGVLLFAVFILGFLHFLLGKGEYSKMPFPAMWLFGGFFFLFIVIYLYFLNRDLKLPVLDILKGERKILYEKICEKKKTIKYGYHQNAGADFTTQPILYEYFFIFNDFKLQIELEDYDAFQESDKVKLSLSFFTNNVIQIERSKNPS